MPASITARITMMAVSVLRACETAGSRNASTPLLTASTPVMAVQPLANDLITIQRLPGICGRQRSRQSHQRRGMAARQQRLDHSDGQHRQHADDEQVGGNHEGHARLAHAAQVDQGDQRQDRQAERQRVGLELGDRRDQGPDPGRDADGHDQHVVEHQRRGREQPRNWCPGSPWPPCRIHRPGDTLRSSAGTRNRR